jgi:hypothetical protein
VTCYRSVQTQNVYVTTTTATATSATTTPPTTTIFNKHPGSLLSCQFSILSVLSPSLIEHGINDPFPLSLAHTHTPISLSLDGPSPSTSRPSHRLINALRAHHTLKLIWGIYHWLHIKKKTSARNITVTPSEQQHPPLRTLINNTSHSFHFHQHTTTHTNHVRRIKTTRFPHLPHLLHIRSLSRW